MRVMVAVVSYNRSDSLSRLCGQLLHAARANNVELFLVVAENSTNSAERARVMETLHTLQSDGVQVTVESRGAGDSIGVARSRVRTLISEWAQTNGRPDVIWFLDDDVELVHEYVQDGRRCIAPLYDTLDVVLSEARNRSIGMLVGAVTGDPPIPPIATYASRLTDLATNLSLMDDANEGDEWSFDPKTLELLQEHDAYYDFSCDVERATWARDARWISFARGVSVGQARNEMLNSTGDIPIGGSFTRPLLANGGVVFRKAGLTPRGGNCVFFDLDLCLEHCYPTLHIDGVETRRSDMIGTWLVYQRHAARVASSGMSVWHRRSRNETWPTCDNLSRNLLGDTWGAGLAHALRYMDDAFGEPTWLGRRCAMIREAARQWKVALDRLKTSRVYRQADARLMKLVGWAQEHLPIDSDGRLDPQLDARLTSTKVEQELRMAAKRFDAGTQW